MKTLMTEGLTEQYGDIIKLWIIRTLLDLKGYMLMSVRYGLDDYERIFTLLGQKQLIDKYEDEAIPRKTLRKTLKPLSDQYEKAAKKPFEGVLFNNADKLAELVGLNEAEKRILVFGVLLESVKELEDVTDVLGDVSLHVLINVLSVILDIERSQVRQALAVDGLLNRTGLFRVQRDSRSQIIYHISIMDDIPAVLLDDGQPDILKAMTLFFVQGQTARLPKQAFDYVNDDYDFLFSYLKHATDIGKKGVNILLFGTPGTGKTELVRTLANDLAVTLYEVTTNLDNSEDDDDRARIDSFLLCQQILKRKKQTLVMFDEIEDAFIRDGNMERFGIRTSADAKKGKYNHMLEVNPVPTIWVSNVISHIDEAIIRRFDYVLEMKVPPQSTRADIIKSYAGALNVSDDWIKRVAKNEHLAPALVSRAVDVVSDLSIQEPKQAEEYLERVLGNTLNAMGYRKKLVTGRQSPMTYRLDVLNADYDLFKLQEGLVKQANGNFCLYGPPGTGKSEYARHLADYLDKPLIVKRASDLLNAYVGETEKNIRSMFEQANDEEALLLCDEADSFLRDRSRARESWEVTQVNELLTQMEQFDGLFLCSTNLMEALDQASLRRFDLKIKFDYLKPEQVWALFKQTLADHQLEIVADVEEWEKKLRAMQGVTFGDFATVVRQNRFVAESLDPQALYDGLKREVTFKQYGAFKGMGFIIP